MKKQFTTALVMAAAITSAQAQVLKFDGTETTIAKGEKCDSVNWYWDEAYEAFPGEFTPAVEDETAPNEKALYIKTESTCNPWERVLKFDGLQIKPATIYRVKVSAKADITEKKDGSVMQIAMMRGNENCDMPWVAETATGGKEEFRANVAEFGTETYTTQTAMFYYGSDELQEKFYADYNKSEAMPDNQFLRLTVNGAGEYYIGEVLVEEAPIAGVVFGGDVIKVNFGFPTNGKALAKATAEGVVILDPSLFTVTVGGEAATVEAAEIKDDGNLYLFLEEPLEEDAEVAVSFNNTGIGLTYSGVLTPGDGKDVMSFENEVATYDEEVSEFASFDWEPVKLLSCTPVDGSFELDGNTTNTFTFTFNKQVGENLPAATLVGNGISEELTPVLSEDGRTITYTRTETSELKKGAYSIVIAEGAVTTIKDIPSETEFRIDIEVGKVQVAGIIYGEPQFIPVEGSNGQASTNWTSYKGDDEWVATGADQRTFTFAGGAYTSGFYLSQRGDASASLTYGEKEEHPFVVPEGDVQFTIVASAWQGNSGNFIYELKDAEGNVVAEGSAACETHQADQGNVSGADRISFNLPNCPGGNYVLKLTTNEGGFDNAIIVWGVETKTYTVSEGETSDNEVKINETFASTGNNKFPIAGTGFNIYDNNNVGAKGGNRSGRNGIMAVNKCDGLTIGFYNRVGMNGGTAADYYMTYGEDDNTPEDNIDEPILELASAKYNFSWMAVNWKVDEVLYHFEILNEDGESVFQYEYTVHANSKESAQATTAEKIELSYTPAAPGRYILKWWAEGECVIGKIKVEKMGSQAVYWHTQLNDALAAAKESRAMYDDDCFVGTTRNKFDADIAAAENPDYHTGAEYQAIIDQLAADAKAMAARAEALSAYETAVANIGNLLAEVEGTKYEKLEAYTTLRDLYEQYAEVDPTGLEDDVLLPTQKGLTNGLDYLKNMKNSVINLYTKQIVTLATQLVALNDAYEFNEVVLSVEDALTDDQTIADELQRTLTYEIYTKLANGEELFSKYDEEFELYEDAPLDVTGYIRNADVYATPLNSVDWSFRISDAAPVFPGWTLDGTGNVNYGWGWGEEKATDTKPSVNAAFKSPWASGAIDVSQVLVNLPVGTYTYTAATGDGAVDGNGEVGSYMYYTIGEGDAAETTEQTFAFNGEGGNRNQSDCAMEGINIVAGENNMGSFTIGAVLSGRGGDGSATDFSQIDNFRLHMTAKAADFDYAAAAKAILGTLTGINSPKLERTDAPVATQYYDLNGRMTSAPKGVTIKVERWNDGQMRISKTIVK